MSPKQMGVEVFSNPKIFSTLEKKCDPGAVGVWEAIFETGQNLGPRVWLAQHPPPGNIAHFFPGRATANFGSRACERTVVSRQE